MTSPFLLLPRSCPTRRRWSVLAALHDVSAPPCKGGPRGTASAGTEPLAGPRLCSALRGWICHCLRMRGWAASRALGQGPGLGENVIPLSVLRILASRASVGGNEAASHTSGHTHLGEAPGLPYQRLLEAPAVLLWFSEWRLLCCPGKSVCIRMLGDASVWAFVDLVQRQLWAQWCSFHRGR